MCGLAIRVVGTVVAAVGDVLAVRNEDKSGHVHAFGPPCGGNGP